MTLRDVDSKPPEESVRLLDDADETGDDNNVLIVLEDGDLELKHTDNEDIQSPLRTVNSVLREAEKFLADGPLEKAPKSRAQILMDEVDVEYSPRKNSIPGQPIEIVVRHSKVTSQTESDSDEEDTPSQPRRKTSSRLSTVHEGKESVPAPSNNHLMPSSSAQPKQGEQWKKGHRRAWSMPNAKGEKMTLAVIQDEKEASEGGSVHSRRIVRYRLHHQNKNGIPSASNGNSTSQTPKLPMAALGPREPMVRFEEIGAASDDDHELEVEINEEEIVYPPDERGKGARTVVKRFWEARWKAENFDGLPEWLQDNEFLRSGHRPPLPSFSSCFKSIFAMHTETGNIWTHMYGCVIFFGIAGWFLFRPDSSVQFWEKIIFSAFFLGAVICMGMSFVFHTVQCHSDSVGKFFSKLDYTGITLLIVGSFIPWIYYGFYCRPQPMFIYITMITVMGIGAMIVSLWDKFAEPKFRPVRAGVFVAMGLSSVVPAFHFLVTDGFKILWEEASLMWLLIMAFFYLFGAALYATRVPERFFPGKCDYWFQSHQLFHTMVVVAALVHFHGITECAMKRLQQGSCPEQLLVRYGSETNPSYLGQWLGLDEPSGVESWSPADITTVF